MKVSFPSKNNLNLMSVVLLCLMSSSRVRLLSKVELSEVDAESETFEKVTLSLTCFWVLTTTNHMINQLRTKTEGRAIRTLFLFLWLPVGHLCSVAYGHAERSLQRHQLSTLHTLVYSLWSHWSGRDSPENWTELRLHNVNKEAGLPSSVFCESWKGLRPKWPKKDSQMDIISVMKDN